MTDSLRDKVVLISGTGTGIGRAAALGFAARGARVVGIDIDEESNQETARLVEEAGHTMTLAPAADLSGPEGARAFVAAALEAHGGIDVLYNNAGGTRFGPFAEASPDDFDFTIRNELGISWHCSQAAWPHLIERGGGSIVMCGSIGGVNGSRDLPQSAHVAAKGAVMALTRQLAAEGAPHGIRVNSVSPGLVASPAVRQLMDAAPGLVQSMVDRTAERRAAEPEEIVGAALFLASEESHYVNGANLMVDGGISALI
ncbi:SDR family NAD(P)-dependent oxidoreductase [Nocardioides acrostichi]|uniref:SDR family oxidoreductase n=1 Tax=Nocardioides acrostichi TaxID=2784339 RepID=A0A930V270_9ACTN|nr:SDR family NAD(P)-dependent oxidoreductase [Nocardioides acrostichi]MBF4163300.1 SDR family oxidoreductase [Nocardioides acrostichi]